MKRSVKLTARQTLILQIVSGLFAAACAAGAVWGIHEFTSQPSRQIDSVIISGGDTVPAHVLEALVWEQLQGMYINLIPRSYTHTYPRDAIRRALLTVPRVASVEVEREGREIKILFTEYEPYALWCGEDAERCVMVDGTGYSFLDAPQLTGGTMYRFVVEGVVPGTGSHVLPKSELQRAVAFSDLIRTNFGYETLVVRYKQSGDIFFELVGGGKLYTSASLSNRQTIENLSIVLESEEYKHLKPSEFNYIDLRFGNKLFVNEERLGEGIEVNATSSATSTADVVESENM